MYPLPTSPHFFVGTDTPAGWPVWAVQRAINRFQDSWNNLPAPSTPLPGTVPEDFTYGSQTQAAVQKLQTLLHLKPSGVVDPNTMRRIVKYFTGDVGWLQPSLIYRQRYLQLPRLLLVSVSEGESNYELGCASWNGSDNVDLGPWQDNIQGSELQDEARVMKGFDVRVQASREFDDLKTWYNANLNLPGCAGDHERAWRRAAMHHNRPLDANVLARFTLDQLESEGAVAFEQSQGVDNPDPWYSPLDWVINLGVHLPNGKPIQTRLEWCRFYALGFPHDNWNGLVCRQVTSWESQV